MSVHCPALAGYYTVPDSRMLVISTPLEMEELEDLLMKFGIIEAA